MKYTQEIKDRIVVEFDKGTLKTSKDIGDLLEVPDFLVRRIISTSKRKFGHYTPFSSKESIIITSKLNEIIVGSLLGDGSISKHKSNGRKSSNSMLVFKHCISQKEYALYKKSLIDSECKAYTSEQYREDARGWNVQPTVTVSTIQNLAFNVYRDIWYPSGVKKVPSNIVISPLSLAIWYQDDGTKAGDSGYYLCTDSFKIVEVESLCNILERDYSFSPNIHKSKPLQYRIYIPSRDVVKFNNVINPFIHNSMEHKLISKSE